MRIWQKVMLAILLAGLLAAIILTWGSIGSILLTFCLLLSGAALLYQRFLTNRDDTDWNME